VNRVRLALKQTPALRVDVRGVTPAALHGLSTAQIERLTVTHGMQTLALAEFFTVARDGADEAGDELLFEGDLARFDRIGWQLTGGSVVVDGSAGDYVGACMSDGEVHVRGSAGLLAACEMAGGTLTIDRDVGEPIAVVPKAAVGHYSRPALSPRECWAIASATAFRVRRISAGSLASASG